MKWIGLSIKKEGLEELKAWVKTKLTEKDQDELAELLDKIFQFEGVGGVFVEQLDGTLFKKLISEGVDSLFPEETEPPVNPS